MTVSSLSSTDALLQEISPASQMQALPMASAASRPLPISTVDQIEDAAARFEPLIPYQPSKPSLIEPIILMMLDKFYSLGVSIQESYVRDVEREQEKVELLHQQNADKLKEAAERAQESGFWSVLQQVGACILSALSTVLGFSLVATGVNPVVGGLLIASGLLSIANMAFSATGVWDWVAEKIARDNEDLQKTLKVVLPGSVGLFCAALGLAGGIGSISGIWSSLNFSQKTLSVLQTTVSFAEGVTAIGSGISENRALHSKADLISLQKEMHVCDRGIEKLTNAMEEVMQEISQSASHAAQIIKLATISNRRVTQA